MANKQMGFFVSVSIKHEHKYKPELICLSWMGMFFPNPGKQQKPCHYFNNERLCCQLCWSEMEFFRF